MFIPILFGIISSIIFYVVIKALLEGDEDEFNVWLNLVRAFVLVILSGIILLFKSRLIAMFWNDIFWNSVLIANVGIAVIIALHCLYRAKMKNVST